MKLFLAGADDKNWSEIIYKTKHSNFLTTFHSHQKGFNKDWLMWYNKTNNLGADWIMDSGLFTMMFGAGSNDTYNEKDLLEYTYKYLNSMDEINYNNYIVEMDVHKVLGLDKLKKFRGIFEKEYDIDKTIYVWHIEEGKDGFDKLCKRYPYIAISVPELRKVLKGKERIDKFISHLIGRANKINPNIKIHLLGCTQQGLMEQSGYYSCDSTSWLSSGQYGTAHYFNINKIKTVKSNTKAWSEYAKKHRKDFDFNTISLNKDSNSYKGNYYLNTYLSAKAYIELNEHINNKHFNGEIVEKLW